jgi:hypothetical protein
MGNSRLLRYDAVFTFNFHGKIKSRLKPQIAWYPSEQNLLSSSLLSKNIKVNTYRIITLPIVLCESEAWSLTLREEHILWVFENRALRRIFGPERDEITGEWRRLHNEELHHLYYLPKTGGPTYPRLSAARKKKIWKIKEINGS